MVDSTINQTNPKKKSGSDQKFGVSGLIADFTGDPKTEEKNITSDNSLPSMGIDLEKDSTDEPIAETVMKTSVTPKRKDIFKISRSNSFSRKKKYILIALIAFLLVSLGFVSYDLFFKNVNWISPIGGTDSKNSDGDFAGIDSSNRFENPINGMYFSKDYAKGFQDLKPIAVMVNNYEEARPSFGLSSADIIYEVVAESGITRLMPIYFSRIPEKVGSIRSARYYFVELSSAYHAHFLHWGAAHVPSCQKADKDSPNYCPPVNGMVETLPMTDAYDRIVQLGAPNLDGGNYACNTANCAFTRDPELVGKVATEHTAVVRMPLVYELARKVRKEDDWHKFTPFTPEWKFKDDAKLQDRGTVGQVTPIIYNYSANRPAFEVKWEYDREKNEYIRYQGGVKQLDRLNDSELRAKTIIVRFTNQESANDKKNHLIYDIVGSGEALIFQDGNVIKGKWLRSTHKDLDLYTDLEGNQIELVRGQIWVQLVPTGRVVSYDSMPIGTTN